jgi:hypothetical protein
MTMCTDIIKLDALNQNWLCGHNLYNALLQGYRTGGRITALGMLVVTVNALTDSNQLASSRLLHCFEVR